MAERPSSNERSTRVPLDWYSRVDRLEIWKRRLLILAVGVAVVWFGVGWLQRDHGQGRYTPGPVTAVHATWDDNCEACHQPFKPISAGSWLSPLLDRGQVGSAQCRSCHAGPIHHVKQADDGQACAACHHEHRGRAADLTRVDDNDCTHCHQDLQAHLRPETRTDFVAVSRFDREHHPEFRLFRADQPQPADPRHLKFKHDVHMTPGMNCNFKVGDIDAADRSRYAAGAADTTLATLQCASCHRLDARDPGSPRSRPDAPRTSGVALSRSSGAYMVPITYENECRACHALTFARRAQNDPQAGLLAVPHGLQPAAVRDFVWGVFANEHLAPAAPPPAPSRPLPGHGVDATTRAEVDQQVKALENYLYCDQLTQAEKILFRGRQTCGECHQYEAAAGEVVPKRISPTSVPDVWFKHARFDHAAHRAVSCRECHAQAYGPTPEPAPLMLPRRDACISCHAPLNARAGLQGGARFDCVECHRYHNGDQPLQGEGAAARGIPDAERRTIEEFLAVPRAGSPRTTPR